MTVNLENAVVKLMHIFGSLLNLFQESARIFTIPSQILPLLSLHG